jgi:DNA-binding transcriptional LysR family regulator
MEIRQLQYFLAVIEEGSFTKAAARVHVAQPGVSAQIRRLEHELGHELLDRSGRLVRPTAVGAALQPHAEAALAAIRDGRLAVDQVAGLLRGQVRVGMVTLVASLDVPGLLADFQTEHSAVEMALTQGSTEDLVSALKAGELDLAFLGMSVDPPPFLQTEVVIDDPLVAVLPPGDEFRERQSVALSELATRQLISLPDGTGTRRRLDLSLAEADLDTRIAFSASDPHVLVQLASRGFGVAILPLGAAQAFGGLPLVPLSDPEMRARIFLAWCNDRATDPAAQAVIRYALDRIRHRDDLQDDAGCHALGDRSVRT